FIRRFLLHVLPKGFHRIRHYGLLASASCKANIAHARQLWLLQWRRVIRRQYTTSPIPTPRPIILRHAPAAAAAWSLSRSLPAAPHRAARPPALGSRSDSDDLPSPPLAASIRQNIPFPASPPAHPGACEHWHDITDQSPIRPSSTTAATTPLSSPALS